MKTDTQKLFSILEKEILGKEDQIPEGFKSRIEWSKEWKCEASKAKRMLAAGVDKGIMDMIRLRRRGASGSIQRVPYYGPVSKRKG